MAQEKKARNIGYWVLIGLTVLTVVPGAAAMVLGADAMSENFEKLGFPLYLIPFLGAAKLAALVVLVLPKFPRLKEWATAGLVFNMLGAAYSHAMAGDPVQNVIMPLVFGGFVLGAYFTRPEGRKLPDAPAKPA